MAKIQYIVGIMRGSLAGVTYSHNKGGDYARKRQAPTNPGSSRQSAVRQILAALAGDWSELTDGQRALWAAYAEDRPRTDPLGGTYTMTGLQAFCSLNCVIIDSGGTQIDVPPNLGIQNPSGPGDPVGVSFTDEDTISVIFTPTPPSGGRGVVWWNGEIGAGQDPDSRQARVVGYTEEDPSGPTTMDLPYAVQDGATCKFWVGHIDAYGQRSQLIPVTVLYTYEAPP